MNETDDPINTLGALLAKLTVLKEQYGANITLDVRYDSGYGHGYLTGTSFFIENDKLRIDVS